MIYVDVTSACLLPLQSGIPRTTRGVYELLVDRRAEVVPIFWQPFRGQFTDLSPRAHRLLDDPFADGAPTEHSPRDATLPLLWASFTDLLGRWPKGVPLAHLLRPEDTLLLTSIFPDNRLEYLHRLAEAPGWKVAIFHDAIPLGDPNVAEWEKKRHLKTLHVLAQMDLVISVSEAAGTELKTLWVKHAISARASVVAVPWPVPFLGPRPDFAAPPMGKRHVLYVSRLKQVKNHATLFAACEILWDKGIDFVLDLIGCDDEAKESTAIRQKIGELRAAGRTIVWHGQVSEEELHMAYQRATFTVFPSVAEGFGLPIVESLWNRRPVICSNEGAVGELARQGGCVTTDVSDPVKLAESMRLLLEDEMCYWTVSRAAFARPLRTWADYWADLQPLLEQR